KFIRQPAQTTASAREMRQGTTCVVRVSNKTHSRPHNAAKCSRFGQCVDISGEKGEFVLSPCSCCCSEKRHESATSGGLPLTNAGTAEAQMQSGARVAGVTERGRVYPVAAIFTILLEATALTVAF